jgi:hypothetical protein
MRSLVLAMLIGMLGGAAVIGCAVSPAEREATIRAWSERDAERGRECAQRGGGFVAGGCVFGGQ